MLRLYGLCLCLFMTSLSFADSHTQALAWVSEQIAMTGERSGSFVQEKNIAVLARPIISEGVYQLQQSDNQLIWHTQKPINSRIIINEQGISEWQQGSQHWLLQAENGQFKTIEQFFSALLQGDLSRLEQYFLISLMSEKGKLPWKIQLVPQQKNLLKAIEKIELQGDSAVTHILLYESDTNTTRIELSP